MYFCCFCKFTTDKENIILCHVEQEHANYQVSSSYRLQIRDMYQGTNVPLDGLSLAEAKEFLVTLNQKTGGVHKAQQERERLLRRLSLNEPASAQSVPVKRPVSRKRRFDGCENVTHKFSKLSVAGKKKQCHGNQKVNCICRICNRESTATDEGNKKLMAHVRGAHHDKQVAFVCKICCCHFPSVRGFVGHYNAHHSGEAKKYPNASSYAHVHFGKYQLIPFCKECGYANFKLYANELGCWCLNRKPTPGKAYDYESLYDGDILDIQGLTYERKRAIPDTYECTKAGTTFAKCVSEDPLAQQAEQTVPKVVIRKLPSSRKSQCPKYGPTPTKEDVGLTESSDKIVAKRRGVAALEKAMEIETSSSLKDYKIPKIKPVEQECGGSSSSSGSSCSSGSDWESENINPVKRSKSNKK